MTIDDDVTETDLALGLAIFVLIMALAGFVIGLIQVWRWLWEAL